MEDLTVALSGGPRKGGVNAGKKIAHLTQIPRAKRFSSASYEKVSPRHGNWKGVGGGLLNRNQRRKKTKILKEGITGGNRGLGKERSFKFNLLQQAVKDRKDKKKNPPTKTPKGGNSRKVNLRMPREVIRGSVPLRDATRRAYNQKKRLGLNSDYQIKR